ncbi:MAG: RNA 2',3'-cyclic phosphodiesterase [Polyangiaceae bacterium]
MESKPTLRLFVAIDPGPEVIRAAGEQIAALRPSAPNARWVRSETLHVTLAFLGERPAADVQPIAEALSAVAARHAPFDLSFGGGGVFGRPARPRVLWMRCASSPVALTRPLVETGDLVRPHIETGAPAGRYAETGVLASSHIETGAPAGRQGETDALGALEADVTGALAPFGHTPDRRGHSAHLTLARSRDPGGDRQLATCVPLLDAAPARTVRVEEVTLYESQLGRAGPTYRALVTAKLRDC